MPSWTLRPLASASFALRRGARRTLARAGTTFVVHQPYPHQLGAHTHVVARLANTRHPTRRVGSSSPPSLRHPVGTTTPRGMSFSSSIAALGGDGFGVSDHRGGRHVTHVASLSDPLPEDVPRWEDGPGLGKTSADLGGSSWTGKNGKTKASKKKDTPTTVSPYAVPTASRIFCNRSLNMNAITAVGFDMDYTLAMYKPETFETLAYEATKKKLVRQFGFPETILDLQYDHTYMVRGLVVDKKRGNVLKMDRHKYVKVARHGFTTLNTLDRIGTYCENTKADQFGGPDYANVDTLFALGETYLFCQLVEMKERLILESNALSEKEKEYDECTAGNGEESKDSSDDQTLRKKTLAEKPFAKMYDEIRASVDLCHRDGTLKRAVAEDPGKFIHADAALVPMLRALRTSGKKVFLLTNSLWDFTNVVMNFLVSQKAGDDKDVEWTRLFDVVITGSCKPGFFENERTAVFEVDVETSDLRNTDDGAPMTPIGASEAEDAPFAGLASFAKRKAGQKDSSIYPPLPGAYQGGSFKHLHAMLGVSSGNQVLYVGDHIYGDVMRSKKTLGWRTMLVVPELAHELDCLEEAEKSGVFEKIRTARTERDALSDETQLRVWRASVVRDASIEAGSGWGGGSALQSSEGAEGSDSDGGDGLRDFGNDPELAELTKRALDAKNKHRETLRELHGTFHPTWGQLMKAGSQNSRFAHQLETYACLYTSHARNLVAYSPRKTYRGQSDWMPHDANDAEHR